MNAEWKKKWVAALRSGDFKQGRMRMYEDGANCAFGVLDAIVSEEIGIAQNVRGLWISPTVREIVGIDGTAKDLFVGKTTVMAMNDLDQKSFDEIADAIEMYA